MATVKTEQAESLYLGKKKKKKKKRKKILIPA